jgi:hypothetical protein
MRLFAPGKYAGVYKSFVEDEAEAMQCKHDEIHRRKKFVRHTFQPHELHFSLCIKYAFLSCGAPEPR